LIKSGGHLSLATKPKEFIKGNMIGFPTSLASLTANGQLSRFANTMLWANLFNRISSARILWGQLASSDYPAFADLITSYGHLTSIYMELEWCLYCIARNKYVLYNAALYARLIAAIQGNKDEPLYLDRIAIQG
jgi:hypothetical protein